MNTKAQATQAGMELLKRVKAKGTRLRVWENLGWHYSVEGPGFTVNPAHQENRYYAMPSPSYTFWCLRDGKEFDRDPNKAIERVVRHARSFVSSLNGIITKAERSIGI